MCIRDRRNPTIETKLHPLKRRETDQHFSQQHSLATNYSKFYAYTYPLLLFHEQHSHGRVSFLSHVGCVDMICLILHIVVITVVSTCWGFFAFVLLCPPRLQVYVQSLPFFSLHCQHYLLNAT